MATDRNSHGTPPGFDAASLTKLVPGFDFLQSLAKGAGAAVPGLSGFGQWVAPTLDPAELDRKIAELRTVQFWLEQNATLLKTTVQALEVQKMTLATLQSMKVPMADLRESLMAKTPLPGGGSDGKETGTGSPLVDPMQWWNALAGQFSELAARALPDRQSGAAAAPAEGDAPAAPKRRASARKRSGG